LVKRKELKEEKIKYNIDELKKKLKKILNKKGDSIFSGTAAEDNWYEHVVPALNEHLYELLPEITEIADDDEKAGIEDNLMDMVIEAFIESLGYKIRV